MTTPVIFRKWKKNACQWESVIAVFPTIPSSAIHSWFCKSYECIRQHGGCDYYNAILPNTVPASYDEYRDLLGELKRIGYDDLVVYRRMQYRFKVEREREIDRMNEVVKKMVGDND